MSELLPCPFCGSGGAFVEGDPGCRTVCCNNHHCQASLMGVSTDDEAIEAWNRRAPSIQGEPVAWQWSDFSGHWFTPDTARLTLQEQEELARACATDHEGRIRPLYDHPTPSAPDAAVEALPMQPEPERPVTDREWFKQLAAVPRRAKFAHEIDELRNEGDTILVNEGDFWDLCFAASKAAQYILETSSPARPGVGGVEAWHAMETAPKDRWIEAYRPAREFGTVDRIVICRWADRAFVDENLADFIWPTDVFDIYEGDFEALIDAGDFYESQGSFTHWRPLPEPPESQP